MPRSSTAFLLATLAAACASPSPTPVLLGQIEEDLRALDNAIGKYQQARGTLPPDLGPSLVREGCLERVLVDPYESGTEYDGIRTYGYFVGHSSQGDYYVVYSRGPDGQRSFEYDPEEDRIDLRGGDDEIQSNLLVR
ncbi:MAG: hypothetical protein HY720_33280 [Planctomycetes bacterium]|nr:hypothetical protein [Planctomycetota bacterium]